MRILFLLLGAFYLTKGDQLQDCDGNLRCIKVTVGDNTFDCHASGPTEVLEGGKGKNLGRERSGDGRSESRKWLGSKGGGEWWRDGWEGVFKISIIFRHREQNKGDESRSGHNVKKLKRCPCCSLSHFLPSPRPPPPRFPRMVTHVHPLNVVPPLPSHSSL